MANINEIGLKITADASNAITNLNKVSGSMKSMESEAGGILSKMKAHWISFAAATAGAMYAAKKAWDIAEMAAAYEDQRAILNSLTGQYNTTASQIISNIQDISRNMISMKDIVDISSQSMARGFAPDKLQELARYADAVGDALSMSAAEGFRALAEAATLGRERTLENIVGIIDLNAVLGEQASKMSDVEKAQVRYNIMLERLKNLYPEAGREVLSTSDKMEQLTTTVQNLQLHMGTGLIRVALGAAGAFQWLAAGVMNAIGALTYLAEKAGWAGAIISPLGMILKKAGVDSKTAFATAEELAGKAADNFSAMVAKSEDLAKVTQKVRDIGDKGAKPASDEIQKLNERLRDMIAKAELSPMAQIIRQAEEMKIQAKGNAGTLLLIEQWKSAEIIKFNKETYEQLIKDTEAGEAWIGEEKFKNAKELLKQEEEFRQKRFELYRDEAQFRVQMYEDSWRQMMDFANQIGGEAGMGLGQMMAGMKGISDIEMGVDPYSQRIDQLQKSIWNAYELQAAGKMSEIELEEYTQQRLFEIDQIYAQQRLVTAQNMFGAMAGAMQTFGALAGRQAGVFFKMYQAFAIAETIISTIQATQDAYKWGMKFGGPPLAVIFAAAAIAAGMARVSAIASQKPGGAGAGTGGAGGGGYSYTSPTEPKWEKAEEKTPQKVIVINQHFYGVTDHDSFAREAITALEKAKADNVH